VFCCEVEPFFSLEGTEEAKACCPATNPKIQIKKKAIFFKDIDKSPTKGCFSNMSLLARDCTRREKSLGCVEVFHKRLRKVNWLTAQGQSPQEQKSVTFF
jgi:hypothetical protein